MAEGIRMRKMDVISGEQASCQLLDARAGATVELPATQSGSEVRLTVSQDTVLTQLLEDGRSSQNWSHHVEPGTELHVGTTATDARLRITVPSGEVTFCTGGTTTTGR
jgi:hypothetical protein